MTTAVSSPATRRLRTITRFVIARGPLVLFAILLIYLALGSPFFLTSQNISSILRQSAADVILACGLAIVVMAGGSDVVMGGIDISLPAAAALGVGIISDQIVAGGKPLTVALLYAAVAVIAVGIVNALLVVVVRLTPLLATLATYVAAVGITRWVTNNRRITVNDSAINTIRDGSILGVPIPAVFAFATFAILAFWVHRTRFGLHLQAVGGNRAAAELVGLRPGRYLAAAFLMASAAAIVASVVLVARGSGLSPGIEDQLLLDMVLATFLGAAFSPRRVVTIPGAMLGAVLVRALGSGFQLLNVDIFKVGMIKGVLILVVVASAALEGRRSR